MEHNFYEQLLQPQHQGSIAILFGALVGGGGNSNNSAGAGFAGGSGVVIVRLLTSDWGTITGGAGTTLRASDTTYIKSWNGITN